MEFLYKDSSLLSDSDIEAAAATLGVYADTLGEFAKKTDYAEPKSFISLPYDENVRTRVLEAASHFDHSALKYVIVIGIGGSNLGARALYDASFGFFDTLDPSRYPKILFLDTSDTRHIARFKQFFDSYVASLEEFVIVVVSKSGTTVETALNTDLLLGALKTRFEKPEERVVVVTDTNSKLWIRAEGLGLSQLAIPPSVGGRFSVFSAAGLFPLTLVDSNIETLCGGARKMLEQCLSKEVLKNPAMLSAVILYLHSQQNKTIHDSFFFHPELESLGKWYRQLLAESIGKEKRLNSHVINIGITPTVSIGSTDLHSMGQLYLGGPKDKITTFVWSKTVAESPPTTGDSLFGVLVPSIKDKNAGMVMEAILSGTKTAYANKELPFMEIVLDDLSERSLGMFMQFKMMEILYLAKLFDVNPFNQPNVETYKEETRKLLEQT